MKFGEPSNLFTPVPKFEDLEGSISNSRSQWLLQIRKELLVMLRKALTFGMVFIFTLSLLAVSMITCFTYDATADDPGMGHYHMRLFHEVEDDGVQCSGSTTHPGDGLVLRTSVLGDTVNSGIFVMLKVSLLAFSITIYLLRWEYAQMTLDEHSSPVEGDCIALVSLQWRATFDPRIE